MNDKQRAVIEAARVLVTEQRRIHKESDWPQKYRAAFGAVADLEIAIAALDAAKPEAVCTLSDLACHVRSAAGREISTADKPEAIRPCSVCGQPTEFACSDCAIDDGRERMVCLKASCRDTHEETHAAKPEAEAVCGTCGDWGAGCPDCNGKEEGERAALKGAGHVGPVQDIDMDDYPFGDAFRAARKKFGNDSVFRWRGESYTTKIVGE